MECNAMRHFRDFSVLRCSCQLPLFQRCRLFVHRRTRFSSKCSCVVILCRTPCIIVFIVQYITYIMTYTYYIVAAYRLEILNVQKFLVLKLQLA
jgi:hypothetical protein